MTYEEWIVLSSANQWPDLGLPDDYLAGFAASSCEGDPRGEVSQETCQAVVENLLARGLLERGPASDGTARTFLYPTSAGRDTYNAEKGHWKEQWDAAFRRLRGRRLGPRPQ